MSGPAVSVLLAVRNEERHLPGALASILRQSLENWELVAVDDGSTDRTAELLDEASRLDSRIRVVSRPARGVAPALNAGLAACRAPLVARMDGDDICHPRRLERQVAFLHRHPGIAVVGCAVRHFPRHGLQEGMLAYERWQNGLDGDAEIRRDLFVESPFAHPSVVFRREAVMAAGGYRNAAWAEDYDLWLRMAAGGAQFARLPQTLFFWRDRPERLTRTAPTCTTGAFRACKIHYLRSGFLRDSDRVTLWGAGSEGKAWRQALADCGIRTVRWLEVDPRKIGQKIHGAPVEAARTARPEDGPILVTVGTRGARPQVRDIAARAGLVEGRDFVCVT